MAQGVVWCGLSRWAGQGWSVSGTTWMGPECRQGSDGGGSSGGAGPGCRTDWSGLGRAGASRPGRAGTGGAGMSQIWVGGFGTACRGRHDPDGLGGEWRVGRPGGAWPGLSTWVETVRHESACRRGSERSGMDRRVWQGMGSRCRIGMGRHGLGRRNGRGRTGVSTGEARQGPGREPARVGTSA